VTPYLRDSSVNVRLGGLDALDNRRFKIGQVRITCLVGPNSAGKTTVFNVITGFPRSSTGSSFNGRRFDRWKRKPVFTKGTDGTGSTNGLPGVPMSDLVGKELESTSNVAKLCIGGIVAGCLVFWSAMLVPFGRPRRAICEDKLGAAATSKSVPRARVLAAVPPCAFAETAGGLYATFPSFIDPSPFDLDSSIPDSSMVLLTKVVVCGALTVTGSISGPIMRLGLPQILTQVGIATEIATAFRQLIYGVLLIASTLFRPQGLAGEML
jgi:branched-chain amino acid transport system permease protein